MQRFDLNSLYNNNVDEDAQFEYFKTMYPVSIRKMQNIVDEACDKMEYDNSIMYDEYPDKVMIRKKSKELVEKATKEYGKCDEIIEDIIEVLFINEIIRRRIRYRKIKGYC